MFADSVRWSHAEGMIARLRPCPSGLRKSRDHFNRGKVSALGERTEEVSKFGNYGRLRGEVALGKRGVTRRRDLLLRRQDGDFGRRLA